MSRTLKLGVNIDHVATLRQARYATMLDAHNAEPDLLAAARECEAAGADSITIHLREDRRHIQDRDVFAVREAIGVHLNLELGATAEEADRLVSNRVKALTEDLKQLAIPESSIRIDMISQIAIYEYQVEKKPLSAVNEGA